MKKFGIEVDFSNVPSLDKGFLPLHRFNKAFLGRADERVGLALERADGMAVVDTRIRRGSEFVGANAYYLKRLVKTMLWVYGGFKVYVCGSEIAYRCIKDAFRHGGERSFDADFMSDVYERPFEVVRVDALPEERASSVRIGGANKGSYIGFDAGGSDRKVAAVVDGKTVFSDETVWLPKTASDPKYHYDGIVDSLKKAAFHLDKVDGVGVSSAGIFIGDRTMKASLFLAVQKEDFDRYVKDIYIRAITDVFGKDVKYAVVNDGDVSALAGAMALCDGGVLGVAMGTSEAGGYVDDNGSITGWLNELAFVPVDANDSAERDEWSGDIGCGVKYFSQDGVIKLALKAGMKFESDLTPAQKLSFVQSRLSGGDERAKEVYENMGIYLGHTLPFYDEWYKFRHVLLLGRVMSGEGGDIILREAKRVLSEEYEPIDVRLPDEKMRRVGQAQAAASLPR